MNRLFLPIVLAAALTATTTHAATYTVVASRDSYIKEGSPSENNGSVTDPIVKTNGSGGDRHRGIYGWTLPVIPAGEVIASVTVRFWVTQLTTQPISIHRVTDTWLENTVNWTNTAADFNGTAETSFTPSTANVYATATVTNLVRGWYNSTYANNGMMLLGANNADAKLTSREWPTVNQRPQLVITTVLSPQLTVVKSSILLSDPINGATNPKSIPGAVVNYTVQASNSANGTADNNSTIITDAVPSTMRLFVGNLGGAGSGPVSFTNGSPSSGLSYTYTSLASITDSISFSNNGGSTYVYTPVPDGNGYDAAVTHFQVNPSGSFAAKTGATDPSFTMQLRMEVK